MSNILSGVGTIARDAEKRFLPSGQAVLNLTIANNIGFGDKQQTLWIRIVVWGKRAEGQLVDHLKKGQQILFSGELSMSEYKANDGTMKTSLELNATVLDLVGGKKEPGQSGQSSVKPSGQHQGQPAAHDNFDDDLDVPF